MLVELRQMRHVSKAVESKREKELRRLALQLVVQLPENPQEALEVVGHMETLVRSFLAGSKPA